jgi:hypothetical protein
MTYLEVLHGECQSLPTRLSTALGTRVADLDDPPGDFELGARVVHGPFEALAHAPLGSPDSGKSAQPWNTVAVGIIRPTIVEELRRVRASHRMRMDQDEKRRCLARAVAAWMQSLPEDTGWYCAGEPTAFGFSSEPRPRAHTTVSTATGRRVGLHLDCWDQLAPRERWRGSNRICLNLGTSPRGLLFIPIPATEFADHLSAAGVDIDHDADAPVDRFAVSSLARRYLEAFPNQTVVRVTLQPGEAYIAPTENLIHDGYAPPGSEADLSLTVRGCFAPIEAEAGPPRRFCLGRDERP